MPLTFHPQPNQIGYLVLNHHQHQPVQMKVILADDQKLIFHNNFRVEFNAIEASICDQSIDNYNFDFGNFKPIPKVRLIEFYDTIFKTES